MKVKVLNDMTLVLKTGQTVDIDDEQYQLVSQFVEKIDEVVETDASVKKNNKKNNKQNKTEK